MDFKKILQSFDAAEDTNSAKSLITGTSDKNTMKAILESLNGIDEASPNDPLAVRVKRAYGAFFDRGDSGLDYLDDHAPLYNQLFDKHGFDFDKVIAHEPDEVLAKLADELESVLDSMQFDLEESKNKPDFPDIDDDGDRKESMEKAAADKKDKKDKVDESKQRPYVCVHAKKGKHNCTASSSHEAAKKAAEHWNLKSTAGIDAHLADKEKIAEAIMVSAEGSEAESLLQILKLSGMSTPAPAAPPAPAPAPMGGSSYDSGPLPALPEPEDDMGMDMDMQDEYSNSPDELEQDIDAVIASGNDLHRDKDQYPATAPGDNPMRAFEGKFKAILNDLLAEDDDKNDTRMGTISVKTDDDRKARAKSYRDKKKDQPVNEDAVSDDELEEIALSYMHEAKQAIEKMEKAVSSLPSNKVIILKSHVRALKDRYKHVARSKSDTRSFAENVESLLHLIVGRLLAFDMPFEAEDIDILRSHLAQMIE